MAEQCDLEFYYGPRTRSEIVLWMLEELGEPYVIHLLNLKGGDHKKPEYLAVNPMGKVPAIVHRGVVVTEAPAICCYLADAFPKAGLSPSLDDPRRGTYLRWLFFAHGCLEPAIVDRILGREAGAQSTVGYGTFDQTVDVLSSAVAKGPYVLGDQFTAVDVVVGAALRWGIFLAKVIPERPELVAYVQRIAVRPAVQRAAERGAKLLREVKGLH